MIDSPVAADLRSALAPLVVSAPFGNYLQPPGVTATLGTFTAARRGGVLNRIWRVLLTVRYYRRLRAWVNRIGLRNPGIDWLVSRAEAGKVDLKDKIVSIHGFEPADWTLLLGRIARLRPLAVELNMSCPNVGHINWPEDLFVRAVASGVPVIVKVPPVNYQLMIEQALAAGIRAFHCCNTLPVPAGGLSGRPLKPVALQCIRELRARPQGEDLLILGGGGIYEPADIDDFSQAGADRFALGTHLMHPKYLFSFGALAEIQRQASARARR